MSDEDRALLARIGQLAGKSCYSQLRAFVLESRRNSPRSGQINRHKSQQSGTAPSNHPAPYRRLFLAHPTNLDGADPCVGNAYRHASAPYPRAGYGGGRPPVAHRHRTLQLSTPRSGSESGAASDGASSGNNNWVSRTDRHRQLINADIYEKEAHNRSKAIEESRQRKIRDQRLGEKARFNAFLRRQANPSNPSVVSTNAGAGPGRNQIIIEGMPFRVVDGGKKLVKIMGGSPKLAGSGQTSVGIDNLPDDIHSAPSTPKSATIAGVTFYRTKTGNLVANRVVQYHWYVPRYWLATSLTASSRSGVVRKKKELCRIFSTTGKYYIEAWGRTGSQLVQMPRVGTRDY